MGGIAAPRLGAHEARLSRAVTSLILGLVVLTLTNGARAQAAAPASGSAAVASSSAATPAAAIGPAPPKPGTSGPPCSQAPIPDLWSSALTAPRDSLLPATSVLPSDADSQAVYQRSSVAPDHIEFRAFLAQQDRPPTVTDPVTVLLVEHPPPPSPGAPAVADAQNAYLLRLHLPRKKDLNPREPLNLVVVACARSDQGGERVVGYAIHPVEVSTTAGATLIAGVLMGTLYLIAGALVWAQRKSDAKRANAIEATPPTRATRIEPWPFLKCLDPVAMSSDQFDRASLSKLQVLFFVMLVGFGAAYSLVRSGALSDLSSSIVFLLGLPALGALGSQAAAVARDRLSLDNWAWLVNRGVFPVNDPGKDRPRWRDLVMADAELDLYKLQAATFSLIVGIALVYSGFTNLATFKVPDTLLQILGLSQVVFVGGRFAKPTTLGDLDDLITELRARASQVRLAAKTGVDVDAAGKPVSQTPSPPAKPILTLDAARAVTPNAVVRYEDTAAEVEILLEGMTHRDVMVQNLRNPFGPSPAGAPP